MLPAAVTSQPRVHCTQANQAAEDVRKPDKFERRNSGECFKTDRYSGLELDAGCLFRLCILSSPASKPLVPKPLGPTPTQSNPVQPSPTHFKTQISPKGTVVGGHQKPPNHAPLTFKHGGGVPQKKLKEWESFRMVLVVHLSCLMW